MISLDQTEDVELCNPEEYFKNLFIINRLLFRGVPFDELSSKKKPSVKSMMVFEKAINDWTEKYRLIRNVKIPENLTTLITVNKKNEQKKLLKGLEITPMILTNFILESSINYGFKFSQYKAEILPKNIEKSKMPFASEILENGEVKIWGKTELSKGQIKQAIEQRKVNIAKFIEKEDVWHCFFANYKSLYGEEIWLGENIAHFHYISSSFGLTKKKVIEELKSGNYQLGNMPHIKLSEF